MRIWAPEGVEVAIERDVFGKPRSITRSGTYAGHTVSARRTYVYESDYQRLCKTIEPESGASVQAYDASGNVAWRASGLDLSSATACDLGSVPDNRKVSFRYDLLERLTGTTHGDGSESTGRNYTSDGLLYQVWTGSSTWTYQYNNRRLLTAESQSTSTGTIAFSYGIDAHGHVASMTYPAGASVNYSPDAFGRPTQVSGYAAGISFHPGGQLAGYAASNGDVHAVGLNVRGLVSTMEYGSAVKDGYGYDANGNVLAITDRAEGGLSSRTMGYDGLDRLTAANGIWGKGALGHDPLDNIRTSQIGARTLTHSIDGKNRLTGLTGSLSISFAYDANGNVITRGGRSFVFDIGNRLNAATGVASYSYDGHGRRWWTQHANGSSTRSLYGLDGRLLYTSDSTKGATRYIYLGSKLIAEDNSLSGVKWIYTDALGSPVATANAQRTVLSRTRYEPFGATAAGSNPNGIGFTGHVNDPETGLVYMRQRYYDPIAGRFLSVDPVTTDAKTGEHFNRYVYAEGNPYRYVDPDGRRIVVVGSDKFRSDAHQALAKINAGPNGQQLIKAANATPMTIRIVETAGPNKTETGANADKAPSNSDVKFNPSSTTSGADATGSTTRPAFVGLAHELGHGVAAAEGKQSFDKGDGKPGTTPKSETQSMKAENGVRADHKLPERASYY